MSSTPDRTAEAAAEELTAIGSLCSRLGELVRHRAGTTPPAIVANLLIYAAKVRNAMQGHLEQVERKT